MLGRYHLLVPHDPRRAGKKASNYPDRNQNVIEGDAASASRPSRSW
jgi:hypothetical protein